MTREFGPFGRRTVLKTAGAGFAAFGLTTQPAMATPTRNRVPNGFEQGLTVSIDDEEWYIAGPPLETAGEGEVPKQDVPGHWWNITARGPDGATRLWGKHYNLFPHPEIADLNLDLPAHLDIEDPDDAAGGWASKIGLPGDDTDDFEDAADTVADAELLYHADGLIEEYDSDRAGELADKGYVHYHEFVHVESGNRHPSKVLWLKHTARTSFWFDGGPPHHGTEPYRVDPGIDFDFLPNWDIEYDPDRPHGP